MTGESEGVSEGESEGESEKEESLAPTGVSEEEAKVLVFSSADKEEEGRESELTDKRESEFTIERRSWSMATTRYAPFCLKSARESSR